MQPTQVSPTRVRHIVLWLTVVAYMITYMDRVVISSAVPSIQKEFGFSTITMGWILASFQWAYAMFQLPGGWLGDRFGPRRALTGIVIWWSIFTSATTMAWSAGSMAATRFLFGMGEAGAFPIATRSLSRWMLPSERGFAQGVTHAGSRLGGALTPALVVLIMANYGWRAPFVVFGAVGVLWALVWFWYYRDTPAEHPGVNAAELELIQSSLGAGARKVGRQSVPWRQIFTSRQMWTISAMYAAYAYGISMYLSWYPKYLNEHWQFDLKQMGMYASLPLLAGVFGDLLGGWISDVWAKRSHDLRNARRLVAIAGFLIACVGGVLATTTQDAYSSVAFSCVAVFGLEITVGISWALALDMGGDAAGSVSAVMNTCGNMGGAFASVIAPYVVRSYGWSTAFMAVSVFCFIAALLYIKIDATKRIVSA